MFSFLRRDQYLDVIIFVKDQFLKPLLDNLADVDAFGNHHFVSFKFSWIDRDDGKYTCKRLGWEV